MPFWTPCQVHMRHATQLGLLWQRQEVGGCVGGWGWALCIYVGEGKVHRPGGRDFWSLGDPG